MTPDSAFYLTRLAKVESTDDTT
ncbi:MAG: hypothetical protein JWN47_1742, partial [Frankiales bacterium]|nr:hypothetical protein [Frankiales bacterium]